MKPALQSRHFSNISIFYADKRRCCLKQHRHQSEASKSLNEVNYDSVTVYTALNGSTKKRQNLDNLSIEAGPQVLQYRLKGRFWLSKIYCDTLTYWLLTEWTIYIQ